MTTKKQFSVRLTDEQIARLSRATDRRTNPYAPTITRVVERGIDLALAELNGEGSTSDLAPT